MQWDFFWDSSPQTPWIPLTTFSNTKSLFEIARFSSTDQYVDNCKNYPQGVPGEWLPGVQPLQGKVWWESQLVWPSQVLFPAPQRQGCSSQILYLSNSTQIATNTETAMLSRTTILIKVKLIVKVTCFGLARYLWSNLSPSKSSETNFTLGRMSRELAQLSSANEKMQELCSVKVMMLMLMLYKGCPPSPDPQFFWTLFKKPLTPPSFWTCCKFF